MQGFFISVRNDRKNTPRRRLRVSNRGRLVSTIHFKYFTCDFRTIQQFIKTFLQARVMIRMKVCQEIMLHIGYVAVREGVNSIMRA